MDIEINTNVSNIDVEVEKAGPQGLSAYQVAVKNGFVGTEQEWLDSLVGEKGDKGDKGDTGEQGIQGERGLQGEQGIQGVQGEKGDKGDKGDKGQDGTNGIDGRDGYVQYTAGDNITIENNVISASGGLAKEKVPTYTLEATTLAPLGGKTNFNATDLTTLGEIFTDAYTNNYEIINILFNASVQYTTTKVQVLLMPSYKVPGSTSIGVFKITDKPTTYKFDYFANTSGTPNNSASEYSIIFGWLNITMSWSDNICTVSFAQFSNATSAIPTTNGVLTKYNTTSFTPTANYHPATKKYVDDKVTTYTGYDASKTQVLKNINGTLTWVDE